MGQSCVALMYGVKASNMNEIRNGDYEWPWEDSNQPAAKRLNWETRPRDAYEGDCVGFSVAVSNGADDDEDELCGGDGEAFLLGEIETAYAKGIKAARKRWEKFSAWLKKQHGIELPKPALILTRDERA